MRLASIALVGAMVLLAACTAPTRLAYRSPLVEVPAEPLVPEGHIAPLPQVVETPHPATPASPNSDATSETLAAIPTPSLEGEAVVSTARKLLGKRTVIIAGRRYSSTCTGLVQAVFAQHGINISGDVPAMFRYTKLHGVIHHDNPGPGDVVFFNETYDRNRDGRQNDGLTHIGIVENVGEDGTVVVIHRVAQGVVRYHMNVAHPKEHADESGQVINDWLRPGRTPRLAGELFVDYGTLIR